jgi:hypothetical protein
LPDKPGIWSPSAIAITFVKDAFFGAATVGLLIYLTSGWLNNASRGAPSTSMA